MTLPSPFPVSTLPPAFVDIQRPRLWRVFPRAAPRSYPSLLSASPRPYMSFTRHIRLFPLLSSLLAPHPSCSPPRFALDCTRPVCHLSPHNIYLPYKVFLGSCLRFRVCSIDIFLVVCLACLLDAVSPTMSIYCMSVRRNVTAPAFFSSPSYSCRYILRGAREGEWTLQRSCVTSVLRVAQR